MRIISGKFRGKKLLAPKSNEIRPTSDRAKEMMFNTIEVILKNKNKKFHDIVILDCFCGSGALGLESISRGCQKVFFLDNSKEAIRLTKKKFKIN